MNWVKYKKYKVSAVKRHLIFVLKIRKKKKIQNGFLGIKDVRIIIIGNHHILLWNVNGRNSTLGPKLETLIKACSLVTGICRSQ